MPNAFAFQSFINSIRRIHSQHDRRRVHNPRQIRGHALAIANRPGDTNPRKLGFVAFSARNTEQSLLNWNIRDSERFFRSELQLFPARFHQRQARVRSSNISGKNYWGALSSLPITQRRPRLP